ncbi:polypeptide N-acetylgalactosaminyltransferase 5-like [Haliotis rufescens]|uniref:polypeptide N-acetylgalactosaminyltransferase 5-like n=1 Tax=Haliotis rufescens TaxID=6454 RepID=UPI00201E8383|nr:polypeptide N-acetylgalactosaminyltransferase 5-like [Haliotis rufescens]
MNGAREARGDVLVFLDAHMEVGVAWLEPLLERIVSQSRIVVQPLFLGVRYRHPKTITNSVANEEEFDSEANDFARPGMSWDLGQNWFPFPSYLYQVGYNQTSAMPAPGLQGSCIVARRSYFMSIRGFDEGLNIWGGEQLELALKVWMTGGRVETVPCSHIGHVFKDNPHIQTEEENDILIKNCLRIAEIWMDEYAEFVIASARADSHSASLPTFTSKEVQSIEEGRVFREHIGSESFEWYLKHVFPELKVPSRHDILWGEVKNNEMCLFVKDNQVIDIDNVCESYGISCRTIFSLDQRGRLRNDDQCFGLDADTMSIVTVTCDEAEAGDGWEYTEHDQLMYKSPHGTYCIGYVKSENIIHLEPCKPTNDHQSWDFQIRFEWD